MAKTAKLIVQEGPFEVYRLGHVLIVQKNGDFHCNLRNADNGFANPAKWVADAIRTEAEAKADAARDDADRRESAAAYLARRADRVAAQPTLF